MKTFSDVTLNMGGQPAIWYFGTNGEAYRIDESAPRGLNSSREKAIARALAQVSLDNLEGNH